MTAKAVEVRAAARAFCRDGGDCHIERLGAGNINDTFRVDSDRIGAFVLQRINGGVFPEPWRVIENFAVVAEYLHSRSRETKIDFVAATPLRTLDGTLLFQDSRGGCWRGQTYLGQRAMHLSERDRLLLAGRTLARFHALTADFDVGRLAEPLPGFHDLPGYLREFDRVLREKPQRVAAGCRGCIESVERLRTRATLLEEARREGLLAVQPVHGDPKLDNFIFSPEGTGGLLDFDTVGAGLVHVDLGDCLRSCCNRAGEEGDDAVADFDLDSCRSLLDGFFSEGLVSFSSVQLDLIFEAVLLLAFELGLRFFTDHLRGNSYFRVSRDGENLGRAIRQFRLVEDISAKEREIRRLVTATSRRAKIIAR